MSKFRRALVNNKGFTLIELLVVIAVLGILAAIAIPRLTGVTDKARTSEAVSALGSIKTALEMEQVETGSYPDNQAAFSDVIAQYLDGYTDNDSSDGTWNGWSVAFASNSGDFTVTMTDGDLQAVLGYNSGDGTYNQVTTSN